MNNAMRKQALFFILCLTAIFSVATIYFFLEKNKADQELVSTYGTVVENNASTHPASSTPTANITFRSTQGQDYRFKSTSKLAPFYQVGETVAVLYPPSQPEQAVDASAQNPQTQLLTTLTILALVYWLLTLFVLQKFQNKTLAFFGRLLALCFGLAFIAVAAYNTYNDWAKTNTAQAVVAGVIADGYTDKVTYYPALKFTTPSGQRITVKSQLGTSINEAVGNYEGNTQPYIHGETIELIYATDAPHQAKAKDFVSQWLIKLLLLAAGLFCIIIAFKKQKPAAHPSQVTPQGTANNAPADDPFKAPDSTFK